MMPLNKVLEQALSDNQFDISQTIQDQLIDYLDLLQQWNQVFNLTAIRDPHEMVWLHILDSLAIRAYLHGDRIIDVGTGAGLPGIPLALTCPDKQFVLLDSNHKKTRFLNQVVYELGLKNVTVVHSRCESFAPEHCFDSIVTRAFATIESMLTATQHVLCEQGQFLAMKGLYPEAEIKAIPEKFTLLAAHRLDINGLDAERHLICIGRK
jgi:16S rRNA (guanine527-N7)-methyltransferase